MTKKILGRCLGTVALVAAALLIARLDVHAAPPEDNREVSQLLEDIKEQAAALQRDSEELEAFTRSDMAWQREAIDRTIPVAQKLASNTTAAIERLNKNPMRINDPQYQQYIKSNAEAASNLAALVRDFVEYGKTRTTLEASERKLEVPR